MKLPAIFLSLGAVGVLTWAVWPDGSGGSSSDFPEQGLFTVRRAELNVVITENGSLIAKDSQQVIFSADGGGEISFLIDEGEEVAEGDLICQLDSSNLEDELETLELDIVTSEADVESARTELELQETQNESDLEKADVALEKAGKELERYTEGDVPNERRKLEVAIKDAQTTYERSKKKYEDSQVLFDKEYVTETDLEQDKIAFEKADVQLEGAKLDQAIFEKYTFPMTLRERNVALSDATREMDAASKRAVTRLRQKEVDLEKDEKRLTRKRKQREETIEEITKMTLRAPGPGIVLHGDPKQPWQSDDVRVGGRIWSGITVATIPDLRVMQVQLAIHEADISKLKEGLPTSVTMDTYPGVVLSGEVSKVASIAGGGDRWNRNSEVKTFQVEVTLEAREDLSLKPGISAKAEIFIANRSDALSVPVQCVVLEEGKHYCYVMSDDGVATRREVVPGLSNENFLEILEGLEEGERVLLYNPTMPTNAVPGVNDEVQDAGDDGGKSRGKSGGRGSKRDQST